MTYRLVIRPEADVELEEATLWYEERSPGLGEEFFALFAETTAGIQQNPFMFAPIFGNARRALLHRFPYSIIYEVVGDELVILACFHERRDPKEWQRRI